MLNIAKSADARHLLTLYLIAHHRLPAYNRVMHLLGISLLATSLFAMQVAIAAPRTKEVVGYVFVRDRAIKPGEIDASKLTRINYAFANLKNGEVVEGFSHDADNYALLTGLKATNSGLRVLASVGGWTWSGGFSDMALSAKSRAKFIESAVRFITKYKLDGIDIDWEYPGMAGAGNRFRVEDKQNFTALLGELRSRLDQEEKRIGRRLLITIAAGASEEYLAHVEMAVVSRSVDTVNLMSYDYYESSSDRLTGHHAPLHVSPGDPKGVSVEGSVRAFLKAGVPADKLVVGVPFYGHAWGSVRADRHGLFEPGGASNLQVTYQSVVNDLIKNGYSRHWDPVASAPYLYNASSRTFVSYEDAESIRAKAAFVNRLHLRGMMFWEYSGDDHETLLNAIAAGMR